MLEAFEPPYDNHLLSLASEPTKVLQHLEANPLPFATSDIQKAQYFGLLSQVYYTLIYPDKALSYAQLSLTFIDQTTQPWLYHNVRLFEAMAFELMGESAKGLENVNSALNWTQDNDSVTTHLMALYVKTLINTSLGHYVDALKTAHNGYSLAPIEQALYTRADFAILIAQIYDARLDYALAIPYYQEAESTFRARQELATVSLILYGLGRAHYLIGKSELGKKQLEESLSIANSIGDKQGAAYALKELANINIQHKNYTLARTQLLKAKNIFGDANNHLTNIYIANLLATVAIQQQNTDLAAFYIAQAEQELVRESMPTLALLLDETNSQLYFEKGKYEESYRMLKSVFGNYKEYRKQQSTDQLHKMRVEYDVRSQELKNNMLSEQNLRQQHELDDEKHRNIYTLLTAILAIALSVLMAALIYRSQSHRRSLEILATTDELTQLYNRRHTLELLKKHIFEAQCDGNDLSVAMIDLDWFKQVNDNFGHATGDQVLRLFSHFCKQNLRSHDVLGRLGGEEFLVILPNTNSDNACRVMDQVRLKMADVTQNIGIPKLVVTISVGLCKWSHGETSEDIIQLADAALYQAKNAGRNQVILWNTASL